MNVIFGKMKPRNIVKFTLFVSLAVFSISLIYTNALAGTKKSAEKEKNQLMQ